MRIFYLSLTCGLFLATAQLAQAQGSQESTTAGPSAQAIWRTLEAAPYTQYGTHGPVIYMLSYTTCGNCKRFLREFWESHKQDIRLRELFTAPDGSTASLNEVADMAFTRSPAIADAYYNRTRVAPSYEAPQRIAAFNKMLAVMNKLQQFFGDVGHERNYYPTFLYWSADEASKTLSISSGWGGPGTGQFHRFESLLAPPTR